MRISKRNIKTLPTGTRLYHGTTSLINFTMPAPFTFFSRGIGQAGSASLWFHYHHKRGRTGIDRVLSFETIRPLVLFKEVNPKDFVSFAKKQGYKTPPKGEFVSNIEYSPYICKGLSRTKIDGTFSEREVMLCDPSKVLRFRRMFRAESKGSSTPLVAGPLYDPTRAGRKLKAVR